jgi:hypothetical protein
MRAGFGFPAKHVAKNSCDDRDFGADLVHGLFFPRLSKPNAAALSIFVEELDARRLLSPVRVEGHAADSTKERNLNETLAIGTTTDHDLECIFQHQVRRR